MDQKQPDNNEVLRTINNYFQGPRNADVQAMTNDEMYSLLRELEQTPYWIAILRYTQQRLLLCQSQMNIVDVHKDPTALSRNQGAMMGLVDLQNAVIQLVETQKKQMAEAQKAEKDKS